MLVFSFSLKSFIKSTRAIPEKRSKKIMNEKNLICHMSALTSGVASNAFEEQNKEYEIWNVEKKIWNLWIFSHTKVKKNLATKFKTFYWNSASRIDISITFLSKLCLKKPNSNLSSRNFKSELSYIFGICFSKVSLHSPNIFPLFIKKVPSTNS